VDDGAPVSQHAGLLARPVEALLPARLGVGFRWLLGSTWAGQLAAGISIAAGPLLVAAQTDDPFLVAMGAFLRWSPSLLFGLVAGVLSDRTDRRRVVVVADSVRVVILAVLITALATGTGGVGLTLVVLGLLATSDVFSSNASRTMTPSLVAPADLGIANARLQGGFVLLFQLVGPAFGAVLFSAGRSWPFVTEVVLLVAGVLLVLPVVLPGRPVDDVPGHPLHELVEGLRWTLRQPAVRTLALTALVMNMAFGAAWSVLVLYARDRLGLGPVGFGLLSTVSATGGLVGVVLYGPISRRVSLGNLMRIGLIIETVMHLVFALTTSPWLASTIFFVFGIHELVWGTTALTVQQRLVPAELQGRVGGVTTICVFGGLFVGTPIGGALAARYGVTAPFWYAFGASALFVVLLWRQFARITVDDEEPAG
jgi:MFS family permease